MDVRCAAIEAVGLLALKGDARSKELLNRTIATGDNRVTVHSAKEALNNISRQHM